jgi:hypothetical protein
MDKRIQDLYMELFSEGSNIFYEFIYPASNISQLTMAIKERAEEFYNIA